MKNKQPSNIGAALFIFAEFTLNKEQNLSKFYNWQALMQSMERNGFALILIEYH